MSSHNFHTKRFIDRIEESLRQMESPVGFKEYPRFQTSVEDLQHALEESRDQMEWGKADHVLLNKATILRIEMALLELYALRIAVSTVVSLRSYALLRTASVVVSELRVSCPELLCLENYAVNS